MRLGVGDFFPVTEDLAVGSDEHAGADDADDGFAVHVFFAPGTVGRHDRLVGIAEECEGQIVFGGECRMVVGSIGADAEDDNVFTAEIGV